MNTIEQWKIYFKNRGLSSQYSELYIPYISRLLENKVPVIFEYEHLSYLLGIKKDKLLAMINAPHVFYRIFSIPKRSGGQRTIHSPLPSLLSCQKWIYDNILLKTKVHSAANGFVHKKSIFTNAQKHLNKKALLKMDMKNFFPSIPINWVINFFSERGYTRKVAFYLASLCCYEGFLIQGAVTSPYLSNILLRNLDKRLDRLAQKYKLIYSRYADDLTFSGDYIPHRFSDIVTKFVQDYGLLINSDKTRLHLKQGQRIVTGLSVAGERLTVPREFKRKLRKELHYIDKYGFLSHIAKLKINNPMYLDQLIGKLNFWKQAEPQNEYIDNYLLKLKRIKKDLFIHL